ncbi:MAG: hypothetical protein JJP05_00275 [cyanobacterium endosymbiont of Rhopalodia gibba]
MKPFPRLFTFAISILVTKFTQIRVLWIFFPSIGQYQIHIIRLNDVTTLPSELGE